MLQEGVTETGEELRSPTPTVVSSVVHPAESQTPRPPTSTPQGRVYTSTVKLPAKKVKTGSRVPRHKPKMSKTQLSTRLMQLD